MSTEEETSDMMTSSGVVKAISTDFYTTDTV